MDAMLYCEILFRWEEVQAFFVFWDILAFVSVECDLFGEGYKNR
jgi:hypothetical protein